MGKKSLTKTSKRKPATKKTEITTKKVSEKLKLRNKTAPTPKKMSAADGKTKKKAVATKSSVKKKPGTTKGTSKTNATTIKIAAKKSTKKTKPLVTKISASVKSKPKNKKPVKITAKKGKTRPALRKPETARSTIRKTATPASPPALSRKPEVTSLPGPGPSETDKRPLPTTRIHGPIGVITHYYSGLHVAVVQLFSGSLRIGDIIQIKGHTTDLIQTIESMEVDHQHVDHTVRGQRFGMKVRDHVREHDQVFKISNGG